MAILPVGAIAPDFTLMDQHGRPRRLSELCAHKPVVVFFYPEDETYGCTIEACAFRDQYAEFQAIGAEVVGISTDSIDSHMRFAAHHNLPYTLLSDPLRTVHKLYGVERALFGMMRARVTFVIDSDRVIRLQYDSVVNFKGHASESLAMVRTLSTATA